MTSARNPDTPKRHALRLAELSPKGATAFDLRFTPADCARAAEALGVPALAKMRLAGQIAPLGKADWDLKARIGATATQTCVLTLVPVRTRIDEEVQRIYRRDMPEFEEGSVVELDMDEREEPLTPVIDLFALAVEAVALALPAYPRAEGAELAETVFAAEDITPMTDADTKPFASLAALKDKLRKE